MKGRFVGISLLVVCLTMSIADAGEKKPVKPTPSDKCPVCGMFVAKYPDFLAEIVFKDGSYAVFDGVKDMAKYFLDMGRYNPSRKASDIDSIYVTDYYSLELIDGIQAYYVSGGNVFGPMGKELIPFLNEQDAGEFIADHAGKALIRWNDITRDKLKALD